MGDETENKPDATANKTMLYGIMTVMVPVIYVLSIGPVAFICNFFGINGAPSALKKFYTPVIWLHDNTVLKEFLEWYLSLFGAR